MNYYERYCGDYARKTAHLTLDGHGAYTVLLDTQYATEAGLPEPYAELYRICRAMTKSEQCAVRLVADQFFPVRADGLRWNDRAVEELAKAKVRIESARANGSHGGRPSKTEGQKETQPVKHRPDSGRMTAPSALDGQNPAETQPVTKPKPRPNPAETHAGVHQTPQAITSLRSVKKRTRLPEGFSVSDEVRKWAEEKGYTRLEDHLEAFIGWALARGAIYEDWDHALRNAIRGNWAKVATNEKKPQTLAEKRAANYQNITGKANGRGHIEGTAQLLDSDPVPALPDPVREQSPDDVGRRRPR